MLLKILTIFNFAVISIANPYKSYPFVFLLDIGNEELAKTKSEQIRVSVPGGSVALRYPAVGNGETITHVRVSGIDYGTDLKANIVDGGPGYKYVVLVFMGNKGVPYDTVVTVETKCSDEEYSKTIERQQYNVPQVIENEENNSAEELNDLPSASPSENLYLKELPYSNSYVNNNNYETHEDESGYVDDDSLNDQITTSNDELDRTIPSSDNKVEKEDPPIGTVAGAVESKKDIHDIYRESPEAENEVDETDEEDRRQDVNLDGYKGALEDVKNERYNDENEDANRIEEDNDDENDDPLEIDQMFNDEEVHNEAYQKIDKTTNFDASDKNAVNY